VLALATVPPHSGVDLEKASVGAETVEVRVVADRGRGAPAREAVVPLPARHPARSTGPWVRRPHPRADRTIVR